MPPRLIIYHGPQAPWSPTAHAFAQFSHVANFCPASYRLEALPDGQAGGMFPRVFGDEFGDKFGDEFGDKFSELLNLVIILVMNLVMNLVNCQIR